MSNHLAVLSQELAAAVERAGQWAVAVHGGSRWAAGGVIWRPGVIVTTDHSLRREDEITLTLPGGGPVAATLAGRDAGSDLAVLRCDAALAPVAAAPADAGPRPGQIALAIGRSENSGVNASMGIVSAVGPAWRTWRGGRLESYIRLDLTFYPGTTGGAVVNTAGDVIGVATSALSRIAGLAIPAADVDRVVDEVLRRGRVARGFLGVGVQPVELPDHQKQQTGAASSSALVVLSLEPGGPAAAAGLLVGDLLFALDGQPVSQAEHIQAVLESRAVGDVLTASVLRGGVAVSAPVAIGERPWRA